MIEGLSDFLRQNKNKIVKKVRTNEVYEETGYSEWTRWNTLVSYDEIEVVDFDSLMEQIEEFEVEFKNNKND